MCMYKRAIISGYRYQDDSPLRHPPSPFPPGYLPAFCLWLIFHISPFFFHRASFHRPHDPPLLRLWLWGFIFQNSNFMVGVRGWICYNMYNGQCICRQIHNYRYSNIFKPGVYSSSNNTNVLFPTTIKIGTIRALIANSLKGICT